MLLFSFVSLFLLLFLFFIIFLNFSSLLFFDEKWGSFECGFYSFSGSFSFSMPFFTVSLMFLLFDVEILLLCFYPLYYCGFMFSFYTWIVLFLILLATIYEWFKGILDWI